MLLVDQLIDASPIYVPSGGMLVNRMGIEVTVGAGAGGVIRLGIYDDFGPNLPLTRPGPIPNNLELDAGTVTSTSTGSRETSAFGSIFLPEGIHWLVACGQGAPAPQATVRALLGYLTGIATTGMLTLADSGTGLVSIRSPKTAAGALPTQFWNDPVADARTWDQPAPRVGIRRPTTG